MVRKKQDLMPPVLNELLESIHKIIRENPKLKEENVEATLKQLRKESTIRQDV